MSNIIERRIPDNMPAPEVPFPGDISNSPVVEKAKEKILEKGKEVIQAAKEIASNPKEKLPEAVGDGVGIAVTVATGSELAGTVAKEVAKRGTEKAIEVVGKMIENKKTGMEREKSVLNDLKEQYPGATILSETYLRDKNGNIVRDPETNAARRLDFVVIQDGKVVDSVEVTSKTADKDAQIAKENRIRENGGNYIKTDDGKLVRIPDSVATRIERRD